jgi:hypothetical protein
LPRLQKNAQAWSPTNIHKPTWRHLPRRQHATLQSWIAGRWIGPKPHAAAQRPDNQLIYHTHAEKIDFDEAVTYARKLGVPALMKLDFQKRAQRLKALACT